MTGEPGALQGYRSRATATFMSVFYLSGCLTYTVVDTDPRAHIESEPEVVRITSTTGEQLTLTRPYVARDSVIQKEPVCRFDREANRRVCPNKGLPFSAVSVLESGSHDRTSSIMLGVAVLGAGVGLVYLVLSAIEIDFPAIDLGSSH